MAAPTCRILSRRTVSSPIPSTARCDRPAGDCGLWKSDINTIAENETGAVSTTANPIKDCSDSRISSAAICTSNLFGQSIYQIPADSGGGTPVNQWISFNRADWTINQTSSMFVRYIQESPVNPIGSVNNSPYNGYDTPKTQYNHGLEVGYSKAITPTPASATKCLIAL